MTSPAPHGRPDDPPASGRAAGDAAAADEARDRVHEQVRVLAAGGAAEVQSARGPVRVVSLRPDRGPAEGGVLLLRDPAEFVDYFPAFAAAAARTARRWWPGPVTLELAGPLAGLGAAAEGGLDGEDGAERTRVRCSDDPALFAVLELSPAPLVQVGGPPGETLVRLDRDGRWEVLEEGEASREDLVRRQGEFVLFVCTGNTCRSPLAEALLRRRLRDAAAEGVRVASAGLSAAYGSPASPESVNLAERAGADLGGHRSQPLTEDLLDAADRVLCMTEGHRAAILRYRPDAADRVTLLDARGGDIPDPIGGEMRDYEDCRVAIDRGLDQLSADLGLTQRSGDAAAGGGGPGTIPPGRT